MIEAITPGGAAVLIEDDGRVQKIIEKPKPASIDTKWNNAGIALLSGAVLEWLPNESEYRANKEIPFPAIIDAWIAAGANLAGIEIPPQWYIDVKDRAIYEKLLLSPSPEFLR